MQQYSAYVFQILFRLLHIQIWHITMHAYCRLTDDLSEATCKWGMPEANYISIYRMQRISELIWYF